MANWIALFRGINVGGKNIVPMKQLTEVLSQAGCQGVKTYIQSGNVLLEHDQADKQILSELLATLVEKSFGFKPNILLISKEQFAKAAKNNPYPQAEEAPKTLHLFFLADEALAANLAALTELKKDSESFQLIGKIFYLHAPDGIGRSKLAERAEKHLGVATTARNWNTVSKLLELTDTG